MYDCNFHVKSLNRVLLKMNCCSHMSWSEATVAAFSSDVRRPSLRCFLLTHTWFICSSALGPVLLTCLSQRPHNLSLYHSCRKVPAKHMAGSIRNLLKIKRKALGHSWGLCEAYHCPLLFHSICLSLCPPLRPVHHVTNGSLPLLLPCLSMSSSTWCALWLSP